MLSIAHNSKLIIRPKYPGVTAMECQQEFDAIYITSSEIRQELNINRTDLFFAIKRGDMPNPGIVINSGRIHLWKRDIARPYIDSWKKRLGR